jgi:DNA topoisomerase-2
MASSSSAKQKYKKHELRDHIYTLPDTYIGSIEQTQLETYIYDSETKMMVKKTINYVPGLYKIYDEVLVNALDHVMRLKEEAKKDKDSDIKFVKNIKITIDKATGYIEIYNDGDGIDIEKNAEGIYYPQMIFGELLTSSNYDQEVDKLWGGKNGYGSKLANIFSKEFIVETVDHRKKKIYTQKFSDNMKITEEPVIKAYSKTPYTKIRFLPDFKRFGLSGFTDEIYDIFHRRGLDAAAITDITVSVFFNEEKLDIKNFEKYIDLFIGNKQTHPRAFETCGERWEVAATYSESHQFEQLSFANGINTTRGGKHVEYITNQITKKLSEMALTKTKKTVKAQHIKDNLMVFVKCLIVNPAFDTQTKDSLTTPVAKFGSKCELPISFFNELYKSGIIEKAISLTDFHQEKQLGKSDGKKNKKLYVNKLDDANEAGTKTSEECTLILTEGDSAKAMAITGLSIIGRGKYGVFPLRGKILNVKDALVAKISANEEIANLKKILGLQQGKKYTNLSELRYGKIMLMTDSDVDGSHIKGLLFNVFQSLWPSLFAHKGFLTSMLTPILKVSKGEITHSFYTQTEFEKWKKIHGDEKGWNIKYYKGLGTSTEDEAKEYFRDMKLVTYEYTGEASDESIDLGFNKKRPDDRKEWLKKFDPSIALEYDPKHPYVKFEDFINKELIHFSNSDLERSINHLLDGLKESTRKILFAAFKRKFTKTEMNVGRFAAYVAEVSDYHHGNTSLEQAIIGMAQTFIGSNNINLFKPKGQFGTRIQGGHDHASPRYIFTLLNNLTMLIYREEDFPILNYKTADTLKIEPDYYIPIIPMVLINGCSGIGTGFSTNLPNFNPTDVINICIFIAESLTEPIESDENISTAKQIIENLEIKDINPWYLGFSGQIIKNNGKSESFISKGRYTWIDDQTVEITELPIGKWTEDYKEFLIELINQGSPVLKDFESHYTTKNIRFILKLYPDVRDKIEGTFETDFQLATSKSLSLRNINLYGEDGAIKTFDTIQTVIKDWAYIRISKYLERKRYQIKDMETEYTFLSAKVKYIQDVIDDVIILKNKKSKEVDKMLSDMKYPKYNIKKSIDESTDDQEKMEESDDNTGGYKYLRSMHMDQVTDEKKAKLEKEAADLFIAIEELKNKKIQDIWKEELEVLSEAWRQHRMDIDREYEDDRLNRKSSLSNKSRKHVNKKK